MKNPNTIADLLQTHYTQFYTQTIKDLSDPGDTMYDSNIRDKTDFGKLLHKEGLWSMYTYGDGKSLLYHLCRGYSGMNQENSPVRPKTGDCMACGSKAPDEIRGLWTLHNFDWIQANGGIDISTWGSDV